MPIIYILVGTEGQYHTAKNPKMQDAGEREKNGKKKEMNKKTQKEMDETITQHVRFV